MSTLSISIPEPLREFINEQVAGGEYPDASEYLASLVREDQRRKAKAALEQQLLAGLNSGPAIEANDEYWREKEARLVAQYGKRP